MLFCILGPSYVSDIKKTKTKAKKDIKRKKKTEVKEEKRVAIKMAKKNKKLKQK